MPLLRDQKNEARVQPAAPNAATEYLDNSLRQEHREKVPISLSIREMDKSSKRASARAQVPGTGGKHQLDDRGIAAVQFAPNVFKAPVPDTIKLHKAANAQNDQNLEHAHNAQHTESGRLLFTDKRRDKTQPPSTSRKNKVG